MFKICCLDNINFGANQDQDYSCVKTKAAKRFCNNNMKRKEAIARKLIECEQQGDNSEKVNDFMEQGKFWISLINPLAE